MRILFISNLFPPEVRGGYEILCEQVCSRFHSRGHAVKVLTTRSKTDNSFPYPVDRILELYLPFSEPARYARARRFLTSRKNYRKTLRAVRAFSPDAVFIWSQLRLTAGCAKAAESTGIPVAYTMNDEHLASYASVGTEWKASVKRLLDQRILGIGISRLQLRHTTCISQTVKLRLCAQGVPVADAEVIFQGIPVEKFPAKAHPGVFTLPTRILYVGQLHDYKGVHTVIEAADLLCRQGFAVELTICGKGDAEYERSLHDLAAKTQCDVSFTGQVLHAQLPEIYRSHDFFVFPSTWAEPFGLTHLEAMSSGTPVISTAEGGQGEFLRHNVNALTFKPGVAEDLAAQIKSCLLDPSIAARIARNARQQVESEFSIDAYVGRLESWLTGILKNQTG